VLLGSLDKSKQLMSDINDMAVKTPFDIGEIRDLSKQMLSFGFSQEELIPTMKMLGDITAGTGGDLKLLTRAYGQVKTKGKLFAQELNQLGEQGVAVREMLAESRGISVSDLMVGMEKKKISVEFEEFANIIEKLHKEKFFGLMAEQADTAGGRLQNFREQLSLLGQEILGVDTTTGEVKIGSLFDTYSTGLKNMLTFVSDNRESIITFFQDLYDTTKKIIDLVQEGSFKAYEDFTKTLQWIIDNKELVIVALSAVAGGFLGLQVAHLVATIAALGGFVPALIAVAGAAWAAAAGLWAAVAPVLPFVLIGALIGALIAGIVLAIMNWGSITEWVSKKWQEFTNWISNIGWIQATIDFFVNSWNGLATFFVNLWNGVVSFFTGIWNTVATFFGTVMEKINSVTSQGIMYTIGFIVGKFIWFQIWLGYKIGEIVISILGFIVNAFLNIRNFIYGLPPVVWDAIVSMAKAFWDWLVWLQGAMTKAFYDMGAFIVKTFWNIVAFMVTLPYRLDTMWKQFVRGAINAGVDAYNWLTGKFNEFINWFVTMDWGKLGKDMLDGIISGLSGLVDKGKEMANNFLRGFKDAMGIKSPSIEMKYAGIDIVKGLDEGIKDQTLTVERRVEIMADSIIGGVADYTPKKKKEQGGLTINQYGASINTTWIPSYAR